MMRSCYRRFFLRFVSQIVLMVSLFRVSCGWSLRRVVHQRYAFSSVLASTSTREDSRSSNSFGRNDMLTQQQREQRKAERQARKEAARAKRQQEHRKRGLPKAVGDYYHNTAAVYQPQPFTAHNGHLPRCFSHPDQPYFTVLGIESSCDDTGAAVVTSTGRILGQALASQDDIHAAWGGVVPGLARDAHEAQIDRIVQQALHEAGMKSADEVDGIAVTIGPGLEICLRVGADKARALAVRHNKPFCAVHHLEAHILMARMMDNQEDEGGSDKRSQNQDAAASLDDAVTTVVEWPATETHHATQRRLDFPFLALLVSGGHCQLLDCHDVGQYDILGGTLDDSLGEALDKTTRLLFGPGHGGGATLEQWAKQGNPDAISLPIPLRNKKNCHFSYAGLKTAVRQAAQDLCAEHNVPDILSLPNATKADLAASFQKAAFTHIEQRLKYAMAEMEWRYSNNDVDGDAARQRVLPLAVVGGVAANQELRRRIQALCESGATNRQWQLVVPPPQYCTDQGAMSAWAGVERFWRGSSDDPVVPDGAMDVYARYPFATLEAEDE